MTRTTNARIAGVTYLLYIVLGLSTLFVARGATAGDGMAAKLASIAQHATELRISMLLGLVTSFTALTLAVALYGITRDEDHELSVMAMCCRVAEAVVGVIPSVATLGLLWLGTSDASAPDPEGAYALAGFLLKVKGWNPTLTATFFAVGSTIFSWLLLRGRMVPVLLAGLGVFASVLLVAVLPLQFVGFASGPFMIIWLPMLVFEVVLAFWLIFKGVAMSSSRSAIGIAR